MDEASGRRVLVRDGVLMLVLAAASLGALERLRHGEVPPGILVVSILLWVPAIARRRYPLLAFALTAGLVAVHWFPSGFDALQLIPADIALLVVLASLTERCGLGWAILATATCEALALSTLLGTAAPPEGHPVAPLVAFTLLAALLGRNVRSRAAVLAALRERAERAERERDQLARIAVADERTRIAREVHDIVAHNVSVMTALADGAGSVLHSPGGTAQAAGAVAAIASTGREALAELHGMLGVLRSDREDHGGQEATDPARPPAPGLADLDALVEQVRATGLPVTLSVAGEVRPLGPAGQLGVYRVVQEALTNVRKHARGARTADVRLTWVDDRLEVVVHDDGSGGPAVGDRLGHGLLGMRERIGALGGTVAAGRSPEGGWRVAACLPLTVRGARG